MKSLLDRDLIKGNILDKIGDHKERLEILERLVWESGSGEGSQAVAEGPGIDLVYSGGTAVIGLGGDTILLFDSGGAPVAEWPFTSAGLIAALAAASSGDMVQLPAGTITITAAITVPAGVALNGISRTNSTIKATTDVGTAMITVNGTMTYIDAQYNLTAHNGGVWLRAVTIGAAGLVTFSSGRCTNTGNTPAYGLDVQTGSSASRSDFYATSTGGTGVGIRIAGTARYMRGEGYDSTIGIGISVAGGTCEYSAGYAVTSATMYDLYVPSGTGTLRWCSASANGDLTVAAGATAYLYANQYDTLAAGGTVYWERGDRQAFHWYDVRLYGAAGDGVTDDTAAIAAAIAAIPATGGVLYFSPGAYVTSGGFVLNKPITVRGDGGSAEYSDPTPVSKVTCNSRTAILFEVTDYGCSFHDLMMINTAALQPTAGAGIQITAGGDLMHFENLHIDGFFIDLDAQDGWAWEMKGCWIVNPVKYGLKMAHPDLPDGGNQNIVNSYFMVIQSLSANTPDAMIRIESGGAPKIVNCKINSDIKATYGIDIEVPQNVSTSVFLISNTSIENVKQEAIHVHTGAAPSNWDYMVFNGLQIAIPGLSAGGRAISITATTSGDLDGIIISNCIFATAGGSPANEAILLTNVNHARICGNFQDGWTDLATEVTCTDVDYCATVDQLHDAVTLDVDAAVILDLTGQEIGLDVQTANTVFAGPTSGAANEPTFRALTLANGDIDDVDITGDGQGDILYHNAGTYEDYPLGVGIDIVNDGGSVKIGNIADGNFIQIDTDTGEIALAGEATAWEDLRVEPTVRAAAGAGVPSFEKYFDDLAGTSKGVYLYSFTDEAVAGNEKEIFFTMQLPHSWKVGTDISFHVHFVPAATVNSSDIIWGLEYTWKAIGEVFGDTVIVYSSVTLMPDDANITAGKHYISEFTDLSPGTAASGLSSILIGRLFRNSSSGSDTYTNKVGLLYIDAHYQVDSFGSFEEYIKEMDSSLLLETGDVLLLESGDALLLE